MKLTKFIYKSGYVAIAGLALLALAFTITLPSVSAITAGSEVTVNIPTILSLTLDNGDSTTTDNDVLFNVTASDMGNLLTKNLAITAQTNNATGYTLTFNDTDADNNLTHTVNNTYTVPSVSANTAPASFPDNKWGYLYASSTITDTTNPNNSTNTNYNPVPLLSAPGTLEITTSPSTATTNMTFATKITEATPAGTYQDNLVFTLVANYVPPSPTFFPNITKMQEMASDICNAVSTPDIAATTIVTSKNAYTDSTTQVPQITLQDTRDNKYYIIRKLADGNCWMAQNLDLEAAGKTLTDQDTDLNSKTSWNGAVEVTLGASWTPGDYAVARYYSPTANQTGDQYYTNGGGTSDQAGLTTWTGSFPDNITTQTPSYLVGNYYTWAAATAGSVDASYSETSKEAPDSICPKGWRLPLYEGNKSWYNLFTTYGIASYGEAEKVLQTPFSLVRPGYYNYGGIGRLANQSTYGYWWSAVAYPTLDSRAQIFYTNHYGSVNSQTQNHVDNGFSVRCVTR